MDYNSKIDDLNGIVEGFFESRSQIIPGIAVSIVQNGKILFQRGMGYSNIENKKKIEMDTVFRVGSTTKILTAIGIMQLWEKGKFKLDDPVNDYLPQEFRILKRKKKWPEITFRHLLTHTSGMGEFRRIRDLLYPGFGIFFKKEKDFNGMPRLSDILDGTIRTCVPAGTEHHYANWGYCTLGYLTEILSGERWEDYIRENILNPLGMDHSDVSPSERVTPFEATGYNAEKDGKFNTTDTLVRIGPAGNLMTTMNDLIVFARMLHNRGSLDGAQIIKPETFELMTQPHFYTHELFHKEFARGLCFYVRNLKNNKIIEHAGNTIGFSCEFSLLPEDKLTLIIFSNVTETLGYPSHIVFLKNMILQHLMGVNDVDIKKLNSIKPLHQGIAKELKGYYGPRLGNMTKLTNSRLYMTGGDFKIYENKVGNLVFSRVFGMNKEEKILYPTENPLVYNLPLKMGDNLSREIKFVFERDESDKISYLNVGSTFFRLRKNKYIQSARLWFYPAAVLYKWLILK